MLVVILLYDQLLFRPLVAWSAKFRFETTAGATAADPWVLRLMRRTRLLQPRRATPSATRAGAYRRAALARSGRAAAAAERRRRALVDVWRGRRAGRRCWSGPLARIVGFVAGDADLGAICGMVLVLGCITLLRVVVLMALATLRLGADRRLARPAAGLGAAGAAAGAVPRRVPGQPAVPALRAVHRAISDLNPDIWLTPLMILGTQWYILFNVIAGAAAFPGDLREAAQQLPRRRLAVVAAR